MNTSSIQEEKDEEEKVETEKHVVNNVTIEEEGKREKAALTLQCTEITECFLL